MKHTTFTLLCIATLTACGTAPAYQGVGGMTAHDIKPEVYAYHFERGFSGVDAMGWDPELQLAWSRLGAANTCGIAYDRDAMIRKLIARFGHDNFAHGMNGIDFHAMQSKKVPGFCTDGRMAELRADMASMAEGRFAPSAGSK